MGKDLAHQPHTHAAVGFGYFSLLFGEDGRIADYGILELNGALETLLSIKAGEWKGKRVSELPGAAFDWLPYRGSVPPEHQTGERNLYIASPELLCGVTVSIAGGCMAVVLRPEAPHAAAQNAWQEQPVIRQLLSLFNSTHDAMLLVEHRDGTFRYLTNNALHKKLSGIFELEGMVPEEILGSEVGGKLTDYYRQCVATGTLLTYEQKFHFASGVRIWQTELTPIFEECEVRFILSCSKDVTEFRAMEEENQLLARRLRSMFEIHDALMLIIEPLTGRIVDVNPAACGFYGYSRAEMLQLLITDLNMLSPQEVQRRRLLAKEKSQRYFRFPHRLKSGDIRIMDVFSSPISDGEGTLLYSILFDVTEREELREQLVQEKEIFRTTLRSIGDGVVTTDNQGLVTSLNLVARELTGWEEEEAVGLPFSQVFRLESEETGLPVENPIQKVLSTGLIVGLANHTVLITRQGKVTPIADSAAPIRGIDGETYGVVMVFRDVSKEYEYNKKIKFLSFRDPLTGLYNRRFMEDVMRRLDRQDNLPISVIMGDVNGLKLTNDVFGHQSGDMLLRQVSRALERSCQSTHFAARWGGDEFMVFMPRTGLEDAEDILGKIRENCAGASLGAIQISLSLGCAVKTLPEGDLLQTVRDAEEHMYHQKLLDGKSYRNAVINTLLATLYERSTETEEHAKRLEKLCHATGRQLGLSSREMDELSLLAILHDIGKVAIDQSILLKPGPLTQAEMADMRLHTEIGFRIAQATPELSVVADYILSHHERWDGTGYPRGLKGEEIPLLCRILAIADAYDAMTNDRAYRRSTDKEKAMEELRANAGTQFDPAVTPVFLEMLRVGG